MTSLIVQIVAALLTIMVLSRIFGDNPFFRTAQYVFVGVSLGLAFVVAYQEVLRPAVAKLLVDPSVNNLLLYVVPLVLGVLLLPRITRRQRWSWLANIPLALIFGIGAALAVGGAVAGTLIPQIRLGAQVTDSAIGQIVGAIVLAFGTVAVLCSFYFTVPRDSSAGRIVQRGAVVGHWLLMIAFGFFFAGAIQTYMVALTEQLRILTTLVAQLLTGSAA